MISIIVATWMLATGRIKWLKTKTEADVEENIKFFLAVLWPYIVADLIINVLLSLFNFLTPAW